MSVFSSHCRILILLCNQPPRSTQPGHPFVGRRNEYQTKYGGTLQLGSKGSVACMWVAGKTVIPLLVMGHECFRAA